MRRVLLAIVLGLALALTSAAASIRPAEAAPQVHKVHKGQHLGMIARRYNVSVEAICQANGLNPKKPIRPGMSLLIPPRDDADGSRTAKQRKTGKAGRSKPARSPATGRSTKPPKVHRVHKGQHLGMIAKRYHVSVEAIRHANDLGRRDPLRPGQRLYIPRADDPDGEAARRYAKKHPAGGDGKAGRDSSGASKRGGKGGKTSWQAYKRPAWRRGFIELRGTSSTWRGYVIGKGGKVLGGAHKAFSRLLATSGGETIKIHPRLIRLIAKVSDTFGGRPIRIVSGYRLESTARRSRHKTGHALDFSIVGVPNAALRDYVKQFPKVGVGYYPNSTFIHLDVRDRWTYWVDYSGPGQAPRYGGIWTRRPPRR